MLLVFGLFAAAMPVADKVYTLKDVSSHDVVLAFAQHLKKEGKMQVPKWVDLALSLIHI